MTKKLERLESKYRAAREALATARTALDAARAEVSRNTRAFESAHPIFDLPRVEREIEALEAEDAVAAAEAAYAAALDSADSACDVSSIHDEASARLARAKQLEAQAAAERQELHAWLHGVRAAHDALTAQRRAAGLPAPRALPKAKRTNVIGDPPIEDQIGAFAAGVIPPPPSNAERISRLRDEAKTLRAIIAEAEAQRADDAAAESELRAIDDERREEQLAIWRAQGERVRADAAKEQAREIEARANALRGRVSGDRMGVR